MIQDHKSEVPVSTVLSWEWKKLTNTCQYCKYHAAVSDGLTFQRNNCKMSSVQLCFNGRKFAMFRKTVRPREILDL